MTVSAFTTHSKLTVLKGQLSDSNAGFKDSFYVNYYYYAETNPSMLA